MSIDGNAAGLSRRPLGKKIVAQAISWALLLAMWPLGITAAQDVQDPQALPSAPAPAPAQSTAGPQYAPQAPDQLQQLVAPIALYPDSLVAQILAASTFPEQVVEADRWVQSHADLKGDALAQAADQETWDPSVKALTAFPTVLGNMDKNISWTSTLGDAYYNQQQDVMDAVQVMRQKAQQAGNLKTTPQQTVTSQGSTVVIQPAAPDVVYVPAYNPWLIYGYPLVAWPGWYPYPGIWYGGPYLSWGIGYGVGFYGGYGWGWGHWGFNWGGHYVVYNNNHYYSQSRTFYNRNAYYRGGQGGASAPYNRGSNRPPSSYTAAHSNVYNSPGATAKPFEGNQPAARGYTAPKGQSNVKTGGFSGYDHGGESRSYSARGSASVGGGGFHGGGGGGGGSHGGGGHH